jgi:UDP-N-acetylmuramyl pentapeptide phosphotransferase/UDP-N-acetylglucosamine-1-phosphate transferase
LAFFPRFTSQEIKLGAHRIAEDRSTSSKLPLVAGPALALGLLAGAISNTTDAEPTHVWWALLATSGFFLFGFIDDAAKAVRGRGVSERAYFAVILLLSIGLVALLVGSGTHGSTTGSRFALATYLGPDSYLALSLWYLFLVLGTTLATSFSDGMDGLTAGSTTILMLGMAVLASSMAQGWPTLVAAGAAGALLWNLPSRWSPSSRSHTIHARVFLGDSGALLLGSAMAASAVAAGFDLLWPLFAGPLLLEGFSSLIQAKLLVPTYRRLVNPRNSDGSPMSHQRFPIPLLASPLHHHWELLGLNRLQVVVMFWSLIAATTILSLAATFATGVWETITLLALSGTCTLGFWIVAMWLRPAFLRIRHESIVIFHGRPIDIGPFRLYRELESIADEKLGVTAEQTNMLNKPMNAHALAGWISANRKQ